MDQETCTKRLEAGTMARVQRDGRGADVDAVA